MYNPQQGYPQVQPYLQPAVVKKDAKALVGAILAIMALVLIVVAILSPWWSARISVDSPLVDYSEEWNAGLQSIRSHGVIFGSTSEKTQTVAEYNEDFKQAHNGKQSAIAGTFTTTFYLTIIALIIVVVGVIFALMVYMGKIRPGIASIILILAIVFALIAPLFIALQLPAASDTDAKAGNSGAENPWPTFMGSSTKDTAGVKETKTWGPAMGWYLMIVAMVMLIIAEALVSRSKKPSSPAPATVYPAQQMAYAPQQYAYAPGQPTGIPPAQAYPAQQYPQQQYPLPQPPQQYQAQPQYPPY